MRSVVYSLLGREFTALSAEGKSALGPAEATGDLLERFEAALSARGLSLNHTVRTRLWARDRQSRDEASRVRVKLLAGEARSASSSYIAPGHFDSEATVAIDLWAMRPAVAHAQKTLREYDPPIVPLRYLVYDSAVFLSGVTSDAGTLEEQLNQVLPRIGDSLKNAGSGWETVTLLSCFLHRGQKLDDLRALIPTIAPIDLSKAEYAFVDGYSSPGKLIEIETTALI